MGFLNSNDLTKNFICFMRRQTSFDLNKFCTLPPKKIKLANIYWEVTQYSLIHTLLYLVFWNSLRGWYCFISQRRKPMPKFIKPVLWDVNQWDTRTTFIISAANYLHFCLYHVLVVVFAELMLYCKQRIPSWVVDKTGHPEPISFLQITILESSYLSLIH